MQSFDNIRGFRYGGIPAAPEDDETRAFKAAATRAMGDGEGDMPFTGEMQMSAQVCVKIKFSSLYLLWLF